MSYVSKARAYVEISHEYADQDAILAFALWLDQQAAQEAMGDKPAPSSHSCPMPSSEGDEYVCRHPLCGRRWDKGEDKPPCPVA